MLVQSSNHVNKRVILPSRPITNQTDLPIGIGPDSAAILPPQSAQMAFEALLTYPNALPGGLDLIASKAGGEGRKGAAKASSRLGARTV